MLQVRFPPSHPDTIQMKNRKCSDEHQKIKNKVKLDYKTVSTKLFSKQEIISATPRKPLEFIGSVSPDFLGRFYRVWIDLDL